MSPSIQDARPAASGGSFLDPAALMRIRNLELRAQVVVEGFWSGMHRSPFHGFSVEFTEYRPYVVGDDLRYLDWRLVARSDRYYIKKFEDETNLPSHLLLDLSPAGTPDTITVTSPTASTSTINTGAGDAADESTSGTGVVSGGSVSTCFGTLLSRAASSALAPTATGGTSTAP